MTKSHTTAKSKSSTWGNDWTTEKLNAFQKYVEAYLTIMDTNKQKYGWKTLYFDGFAGSGDLKKNNNTSEEIANAPSLLDFDIAEVETEVYKGAAERVLNLKKKFDYYYFIDLNGESLNKLRERLSQFDMGHKLQFRDEDANKSIKDMAAALRKDKKLKALVLLDPFGMQINWESIELLKGTSSDVWILIPSGMIINRLLYRNGKMKPAYIQKLCSFFGMTEEEIRNEFYTEKVSSTLFGEETTIQKNEGSIRKIADLYIRRLKEIWSNVSDEPLVMNNTKNVAIFHFVFASNNAIAKRIAKQIVSSKRYENDKN